MENDLFLLNTLDIATNPYGNTIDLAFTNIPLAKATIEDHLATSSNHFTLSISLPYPNLVPIQPSKVQLITEDKLKCFMEIVELKCEGIPSTASSTTELDELASALIGLLQIAARAAGRPVRKGGRSALWWTKECAGATAEYRAIRRLYPLGFGKEV
ncbi:hypothetical protein BGZ63DRAFT_409562 [Mariannaea sp. PMI_226]|nr:hypothetical protein BGZ63DRAFT_409562 [Mariannaea sp. PMI_226]